jgi:benzoyl-CoA reductase/2-hydroxyglutaryl-CoA dehydratase subunit BcrC/BadD/HgdB
MTDALSIFQAAAEDRDAAARAFKAAGGKVVGYVGNTVPVELILAVGAYPLRLTEVFAETPHADRYMEELFDPIVRGVFEKMLAGGYSFLDAVVLPRTSDSIQRLYYYLCEVRRLGEADVPAPLLYDLLHTPWSTSADYNDARTAELFEALGLITGAAPDPERLSAAIGAANDRRRALTAFADARRTAPARVSGAEANAVFVASQTLPVEEFTIALDAAAPLFTDRFAGKRLVLAGSGHPSPTLHRLIEAGGAVVVGDFHEFGEPMIGPEIALNELPLRTLASHYHRNVASSRTFPQATAPLTDFVRACGAEGVIFYYLYEEEALTWEYPAQRRALEAMGVPSICFEGMASVPDEATVGERIAAFVAALSVRAPA